MGALAEAALVEDILQLLKMAGYEGIIWKEQTNDRFYTRFVIA